MFYPPESRLSDLSSLLWEMSTGSVSDVLNGTVRDLEPSARGPLQDLSPEALYQTFKHSFCWKKKGYELTSDDRIDRVVRAWVYPYRGDSDYIALLDMFTATSDTAPAIPPFIQKYPNPAARRKPPFIFDREAWATITAHVFPLRILLTGLTRYDAEDHDFRRRGGIISAIRSKIEQHQHGIAFIDPELAKMEPAEILALASLLGRDDQIDEEIVRTAFLLTLKDKEFPRIAKRVAEIPYEILIAAVSSGDTVVASAAYNELHRRVTKEEDHREATLLKVMFGSLAERVHPGARSLNQKQLLSVGRTCDLLMTIDHEYTLASIRRSYTSPQPPPLGEIIDDQNQAEDFMAYLMVHFRSMDTNEEMALGRMYILNVVARLGQLFPTAYEKPEMKTLVLSVNDKLVEDSKVGYDHNAADKEAKSRNLKSEIEAFFDIRGAYLAANRKT